MRRTLKLLLLLGIGLLMAKPGGGDPTPGGGDPTPGGNGQEVDPITGRPKNDAKRDEAMTYKGQNAAQDMAGVHTAARTEGEAGRAGDADGDGTPDVPETAETDQTGTTDETPNESAVDPLPEGVQDDWTSREADNGQGTVYQDPNSGGNANMLRVMDPTGRYPNGYVRFYNQHGQPIGSDGKPGPRSATHIPMNPDGTYDIPEGWGE